MTRLIRTVLLAAPPGRAASATAREWGGMDAPLAETDLALVSDAADRLRIEVSGDEPFASTPVMCAGGDWRLVTQR